MNHDPAARLIARLLALRFLPREDAEVRRLLDVLRAEDLAGATVFKGMAGFGHDRDGKTGLPIIVYRVLTDADGRVTSFTFDDAGRKLGELLRACDVDCRGLLGVPERLTSIKTRVVAHQQQVRTRLDGFEQLVGQDQVEHGGLVHHLGGEAEELGRAVAPEPAA